MFFFQVDLNIPSKKMCFQFAIMLTQKVYFQKSNT